MYAILQVTLSLFATILHLISISTTYWVVGPKTQDQQGRYTHNGLWISCNVNGIRTSNIRQVDQCARVNHLQMPYIKLAEFFAILIVFAIPMYLMILILKEKYLFNISSKNVIMRHSGTFKCIIASSSFLLTVLVMIFATTTEANYRVPFGNSQAYRSDTFGWSFYLELVVALILFVLTVFSLMEKFVYKDDQPLATEPSTRLPLRTRKL